MAYQTKEHVVAFIDILGAKKKIKEDSEKSLNVVHEVYNAAIEICNKLYTRENIANLKPIIKIFSDNIVIAVPTISSSIYSAFASISIFCGVIQQEFLNRQYLVRGGIAIGDFFADDVMIWGKALLNAYYVESNIAIYPRIVIHPDVVGKLQLTTNPNRQKWVMQDNDGLFFIDYIQEHSDKSIHLELLIYRIQDCDELIADANGDIKALQKIHWHTAYLNSKLGIYSSQVSQSGLLSAAIEMIEEKTRLIEEGQ